MNRKLPSRILNMSEYVLGYLLWCYPKGYRQSYSIDIARTFRDCSRDVYRQSGSLGLIALWIETFLDLMKSAVVQHFMCGHNIVSNYLKHLQETNIMLKYLFQTIRQYWLATLPLYLLSVMVVCFIWFVAKDPVYASIVVLPLTEKSNAARFSQFGLEQELSDIEELIVTPTIEQFVAEESEYDISSFRVIGHNEAMIEIMVSGSDAEATTQLANTVGRKIVGDTSKLNISSELFTFAPVRVLSAYSLGPTLHNVLFDSALLGLLLGGILVLIQYLISKFSNSNRGDGSCFQTA